ncbi:MULTISPECIES: class III lanthionine synthetase LanKC [unclassified Streptomyces]|uniref:class III lanthionine synthetase LanKC n=1 Tax=unclassified Streptomyces TaxID=2593676 RepID=UPI000DBA22C1|nr:MULTISPECIES: class III lanthionine synthetase LanKC [unclassified Streptomyces]MYT70839.1 lantipeptide synthetase [Streptomyces sp. SID8367]
MDKRYEIYALADPHFYETPERLSGNGQARTLPEFDTARRPVPAGWRSDSNGEWLNLTPAADDGTPLQGPLQGWKIHASATRENAEKTAAVIWDYCTARGIPFKFVPAPHLLHLRNAKYAGRDTSGKFATIYPADETRCHRILEELGELLAGFEGPYILTDLRWGEGPLYVRYGAFARRMVVDPRGTLVSAVEDAGGRLVPDNRDPAFQIPEWVSLPAFLKPHLDARNATTVAELPYRFEKALHFSNGGGVYRGVDTRDERTVVLKEGRPHAGLAADGADAIARLEREKAALERLSGLGVAPGVRDWFLVDDHRFLVMDHVPGRPLNAYFAERHPLLAADPDPEKVAAYAAWALGIVAAVEAAVARVHERGVVFNDLHMFNIMVDPDEHTVTLIDFEAATRVEESGGQMLAHPGFWAPFDRSGTEIDHYALACLRLAMFLPVTTLFVVDRAKAAHLADVIAAEFPTVPRTFLDEAVAEITRDAGAGEESAPTAARRTAPGAAALPEPADWPAARDSMVAGILASATPDRDDRLFPGDVVQFATGGGLGLAHGAAGVLLALDLTGAGRFEQGERWLLDHTAPTPRGTALGLYDGLAGIAYALHHLGHPQRALDQLDTLLGEKWQRLAVQLHSGLAGVGLVLDHLAHATGESALADRAAEATALVAERITEALAADGDGGPQRKAGLMRGLSGPALFLLRRHERTGDPALLGLARQALELDLRRCRTSSDGGLHVDEGWRTMPYLADGSAGIGMVVDDYLALAPDDDLERARAGAVIAASSRFYIQPGLFEGRAGMILHLARTTAPQAQDRHLAAQIDGLGWLSMRYRDHLAFPGHQMMRLSMDLATGTAGCLLALGAAHGTPAHLPFLPPLRRP